MKRWIFFALLGIFLLAGYGHVWAGDVKEGKSLASDCKDCHGSKGISSMSESPNLAGQQEQYLINAMKRYRDGTFENDLMTPVMESLSDEDIENLAAYFTSLDCK